jgi:alginate O-acetyltransferase complex protein AlgI
VIGYRPTSLEIVVAIAAVLVAELIAGLLLTRRARPGALPLAWATVAIAVFGMERLTSGEPAGVRMLSICGALLVGFKGVVGTADLAAGRPALPAVRWVGFALAWPGMDPQPFERRGAAETSPQWRRLFAYAAGGAFSIWFAHRLWLATGNAWLATAPLLLGLSLALHFALFGLAAAVWRRAGFPCREPFSAPRKSESLAEFWGRRWNRPFSELMRKTLYGPLSGRGLVATATFAAFLLSGLLHELAISVPARAGYGRPTAYFALQGVFVLAERKWAPHAASGVRTWIAILGPLPLLLIPEFLRAAVWPIAGIG